MSLESLIRKWQPVLDEAQHIFTWTEPHCAAWLCERASQCELAAETGVYMGYTSFVMLKANPKLHLWSIDPFMVVGTEKTSRYFLREFIAEGRCEILPKFTKDAAAQLEHMRGKLDMVWVDDGHALQDVLTDISCMLPLVRTGGMLCGHDYETDPANEVTMAVHQSLEGHYEPVPRLWAFVK